MKTEYLREEVYGERKGIMSEKGTDCYVVFCGNAVRVNARYQTRIEIEHKIETLRP